MLFEYALVLVMVSIDVFVVLGQLREGVSATLSPSRLDYDMYQYLKFKWAPRGEW